jgi:NAD(P)H-flavin reductase
MYKEELERLVKTHPNFKIHITASRPDDHWSHAKGYVQDSLKSYSSPHKDRAKVYVCGKPEVAEQLVKFCIEEVKFPAENVIIEKW